MQYGYYQENDFYLDHASNTVKFIQSSVYCEAQTIRQLLIFNVGISIIALSD